MSKLWHRSAYSGGSAAGPSPGCEFVVEMTVDSEAHLLAGAPEMLAYVVTASAVGVTWDVIQMNKRPTRLPEAGFFSFNPSVASADPDGWRLQVLGSPNINPTDVVGAGPGGSSYNTSSYGGSPHLRGVDAVTWRASPQATAAAAQMQPKFAINITSLDVPVVCTGAPTPFPSPRTGRSKEGNGSYRESARGH